MNTIFAESAQAQAALTLVRNLQQRFVTQLEAIAPEASTVFAPVHWQRDEGYHGGGTRIATADTACYNRASVNVSQVHYDDNGDKKLGSATAISTIIHPCHPLAPSVHIHISWTEMKSGQGYWRMMADLNPATACPADIARFTAALQAACPDTELFSYAQAQGDRYFYIPVLQRHRGVTHFYLEQYHSDDQAADSALAQAVGEAAIDTYAAILSDKLSTLSTASEAAKTAQRYYHTLYTFQVLTLDRGTTTGLLIHQQNDTGILGSLPAQVDRELLQSWLPNMPKPQDQLLQGIIAALPSEVRYPTINDACKQRLADTVRQHYHQHPEAMEMQAAGDIQPPTVRNHIN
jgi:coproporphyrinogen III oxidase